jgi:hypothetical protein
MNPKLDWIPMACSGSQSVFVGFWGLYPTVVNYFPTRWQLCMEQWCYLVLESDSQDCEEPQSINSIALPKLEFPSKYHQWNDTETITNFL